MSDRSKLLVTLLVGAAAGVALGVLFAPSSGKETRERMRRKADEAKDGLDELISEGRKKWSEAKGRSNDPEPMSGEDIEEFLQFLMKEGKDLWDRLKKEGEASDAHTDPRPQDQPNL